MSGSKQRLIPASTTLLQPGSRFFRISDSLNYQAGVNSSIQVQNGSLNNVITTMQGQITVLQGQVTTLQGNITTLQGEINTLNTTVADLQSQIDTINTRLTNAGIP